MAKPYIVGITGGSASGKTSFLNQLLATFEPGQVCLLSQDNYYKPIEEQYTDEQGIVNFDLPTALNHQAFAHDIALLQAGQTLHRKQYTFNNPAVVAQELIYKPAPVLVVEGIFVFYFAELARLIDLKVFIDASEHVKLARRLQRDKEERGYAADDVLYRYTHHIAPTYEKYIRPFKQDADLVIPNNTGFNNALAVLTAYLQSKI